ncbi:MAG: PLP-dependent aminotransferase family protein [Deltaproteobacteria bacterium]|nr:PLP-dependent aminotransferase family protein [Deltaproteobacteria bacterium]
MWIQLDGEGPLGVQLFQALRGAILSGRLPPSSRLPASRALAGELGLSRNTVIVAYDQLLAEGYASARVGAGTYVASELPEESIAVAKAKPRPRSNEAAGEKRVEALALGDAGVQPNAPRLSRFAQRLAETMAQGRVVWTPRPRPLLCDFRYGRPSFEDLPHEAWCRVLARRARRASVRTLDYGSPEGVPELREELAAYLRRARGVACEPEQIVIVSGSQQALDLVGRVLLDPGDTVVVEEPHYPAARAAFRSVDAEVRAVPVDERGLDVRGLAGLGPVRLAYVTPAHQFPTGVTMPLARRLELLRWARDEDALVVEDDYDSEYRFAGRPVQALQGIDRDGRVLYAGTFSKLLFPSLRLGFFVLPPALVDPFRLAKAAADTGSPTLLQLALADFIREGLFERHLRRSRTRNAARRAALLGSIEKHLGDRVEVVGADAGLHVMLWLRGADAAEARRVRRRAGTAGVGVYPIEPFYLDPPDRGGLLLGYASLQERDIERGIRILAESWDEVACVK